MTLSAIGVVMGSILDTMRAADVPNSLAHVFLDQLEGGFRHVLYGESLGLMLELIDVLRANVASND